MKRASRNHRSAPRALNSHQLPRIKGGIWVDLDRTCLSQIVGGVQAARENLILREDEIYGIVLGIEIEDGDDPLGGVE